MVHITKVPLYGENLVGECKLLSENFVIEVDMVISSELI